jgi:hypothetical protein
MAKEPHSAIKVGNNYKSIHQVKAYAKGTL